MKMKMVYALLVMVGFLTLALMAGGDEGRHGWHDQNGNCIQGAESFKAHVMLSAADGAPAGAGGVAKIRAQNQDGTVTGFLAVNLHGLPAGDYTIGISNLADGSVVALGQVTVTACSTSGDDDGENDNEDGDQSGGSGDEQNSGDCTFARGHHAAIGSEPVGHCRRGGNGCEWHAGAVG